MACPDRNRLLGSRRPLAGKHRCSSRCDHVLFQYRLGDEFVLWRSVEIGGDLAFEDRMVARWSLKEIGLMHDDLVGDLALVPRGVKDHYLVRRMA